MSTRNDRGISWMTIAGIFIVGWLLMNILFGWVLHWIRLMLQLIGLLVVVALFVRFSRGSRQSDD